MTFARNGKQTKKAEGWTEDKKHPHWLEPEEKGQEKL
jgi:hypothetical protein